MGKREAGSEVGRVEIVKEQAADAARFVAVLDKEIVIAPLFVFRVHVVAEGGTELKRCAVPVNGVLGKAIEGR
ncbi:hypothetical protein D3C72_2454330 [compost metagenome]